MPEAEKLSASIMRRSTDFHRNSTRRLHRKELYDASPTQSLTEDDRASRIRSVLEIPPWPNPNGSVTLIMDAWGDLNIHAVAGRPLLHHSAD